MAKAKDLTGQRFGRLVAIENTGNKRGGRYLWKCICDCGNETLANTNNLSKGNTKSCGCLQRENQYLAEDVTGERFGRLVAIEKTSEKQNHGYKWLCKCDCGNEHTVLIANLKNGNTKSCGCLKTDISKSNIKIVHSMMNGDDYVERTQLSQLTSVVQTNNTSGEKGVRWNEDRMLWHAYAWFKGEMVFSDFFQTEQDAINARKEAEEKYFKPILEKYGKTL